MSDISISDIRRNTNDFSFVDTLGSFINNYEFKQSYDQFKLSNDNKSSYVWSVLSTIGGEYANTIYENVLNYIDNVANIDLCKVKSLQSMIKVLGIDYDIVNDISKMPVEIVNLIDILSVNKRYLLDSTTFASQFHEILRNYDFGKCIVEAPENDMSVELSDAVKINDAASYLDADDGVISVQLSDYFIQPGYIDNAEYKLMLVDIFKQLIESNIYMQYADAESQLSSANTYIYQYISDKLLAKDNVTVETADAYDEEIKSLKIKYRLQGFKQDEVMDAIESGNDYFDRYNQYQQAVLSAEQKRRNATYPYAKTYVQSEDSSEGYSLTRYSWYREQKVMEYFKFVEDTYSSLINAKSNDIESVLKGTSNTHINVYDKDESYFIIDQTTKSSLLYYDKTGNTPSYKIRSTYINTVAELLAQQVLDLADIRDQIKIQLRKSYMKGTFLLLSYVINEYLKYDISKNYGNVVYTQDENIPLSSYIDECIKNNGVQIVEYKDQTEYFNLSSADDLCAQAMLDLSILNITKANPKFYDNEESKLGETSQDIPLEEIDYFYRNQLNLRARGTQTSSDLVNFLSLIYDYGANESFLADRSDDISSQFRLSGEFYCKVWNDKLSAQQWQGDIDVAYALHEKQLSIANACKEHLDSWKAEQYEEEATAISAQLSSLSSFISAWWHDSVIPKVPSFIEEMDILQQVEQLLKDNGLYENDNDLLSDVLSKLAQTLQEKMDFVESQREHYNIQKEIFLKYNGTDVGYDPFYNFKNVTHSSYQIHPYLYNFVEVNKLEYPLANTFFVAFTEDYEKQLVRTGLDNIIGKYGNVINLSKHGMLDWTGYQSQYEKDFSSETDVNLRQLPEQFAYAGAFYPPALEEFLADSPAFIQKVQDNTPDSYYYKLNLSQEELNKISEQLRIYEKPIREIVRCPRAETQRDNALSAEYDIYKYTQDIYGNSLILFKSYKYLYKQNEKVKSYAPSYNEKKNAPGELWMRIKNHPIAFPAFDLRPDYMDLTQYSNSDVITDQHKLNGYIKTANDYFSDRTKFSGVIGDTSLADVTKDAIQLCFASANQHMRCFFDMELTPDKRSLLLVVPMQTGTAAKRGSQDWSTFTYGNSNIIVGQLWQDYDYVKDMNVYAFQTANIKENVEDVTNNVDNIRSSKDLLTTKDVPSTGETREVTEFVGFAKHSNYIIAVYVFKFWYSQKKMLKSFVAPTRRNSKPVLQLECWCYNGTRKRSVIATQELKYDVLYKAGDDYKYANTLAIASNNDIITICYISDEFQKAYSPKPGSSARKYTEDTTIVNFAEYTNVVDKASLTAFGENVKYPSDTAVLQTTDAQHINIYNSFDSFTSYIVNVDFKFVGSRVVAKQMRHYNLNTDCGYYPLFADAHGKSRLYANSALSSKSQYSFQLLGPENSDIDYTPVILDTNVQEQNGRVTEDYRDYSKTTVFNNAFKLEKNEHVTSCTFQLSDVFVDDNGNSTYNDLAETGTLRNYRWNIANTSYTATPVARGTLAQAYPTDYYYVSSSMYDTLSGQEMFGPNGTTFQGTTNTNHIDGISAIGIEVVFDEDQLPTAIQLSVMFDGRYDTSNGAEIPESQFQLFLYAKNSNVTYDYYRIIENGIQAPGMQDMLRSYADEISFKDIAVLSDFEIDGKYPFRNISSESNYKQMIAPYMFKYSEEDPVDREFPLLAATDVNDEVVYLANEDQYIYFFSVDGHDTVEKDIFYMEKYDVNISAYTKVKVNTISKKYQEFYDKSLTIEATYNVEEVDGDYGIVLYFNYKNFTSPQYVNFKKRFAADGTAMPPEWSVCTSTSKGIEHTYLRLAPGKSGRLDIRVDYVEYAKVNAKDLTQSVVGKESRTLRTYYIMNVSDDKPKFVISRQPFR